MGMFHSTSGKVGYDNYAVSSYSHIIPKNVMKQILQREDEMRFSVEYHTAISQHENLTWIRDVTIEMQRAVLREFGYDDALSLNLLHAARTQYKDDEEMNKLAVYQRMDRSRRGELVVGCDVPCVTISTLDGGTIILQDYMEQLKRKRGGESRPIVITAGSLT